MIIEEVEYCFGDYGDGVIATHIVMITLRKIIQWARQGDPMIYSRKK